MKRKVIITVVLMVIIALLGQASYAAIEITPSASQGADVMRNTTVSNSFLLCRSMTNEGESLYGATVIPHLVTNADWGAVSYLSNSIYGTNTAGQNTGVEITIDGTKYYSTTGNVTGVMNWGSNPYYDYWTQTSSLIESFVNDSTGSTAVDHVTELEANKNTRFVETIAQSFSNQEKGQAFRETAGLFDGTYSFPWEEYNYDINTPITIRKGLYGYWIGCWSHHSGWERYWCNGSADGSVTFRPVIWNK